MQSNYDGQWHVSTKTNNNKINDRHKPVNRQLHMVADVQNGL